MQPFVELTGIAVPFGAANIDTDVIVPARFLKTAMGWQRVAEA